MSKFNTLSSYISKCQKVIDENNIKEAKELQTEIIAVYGSEISDITSNLDNYNWSHMYDSKPSVDFIGDAKLLKAKLNNYLNNLKMGNPTVANNKPSITINNSSNANAQSNAINQTAINYEQTIRDINSLPAEILTKEEKEELEDKLAALEMAINLKDKTKISEKLMNVLKFVAIKGPEVYLVISKFLGMISDNILPLFHK